MAERISLSITKCLATVAAGFERCEGLRGFWYRRFEPPLFSIVVIQHSSKHKCFGVDVASTVFCTWDRQYGFHQLRRATGLANLRVGSNAISMDDVPYYYGADRQEALDRIDQELRCYAVPWFEAHRRDIAQDALVQYGFAQVMNVEPGGISVDDLKWSLRGEAARVGASKWQRQQTAILAADLLRLSAERQPASASGLNDWRVT